MLHYLHDIAWFLFGMFTLYSIQEIKRQHTKYVEFCEKLDEMQKRDGLCKHGYYDWSDCPDCGH